MSGIVGFINRDGEPADRGLIERMARPLLARAPERLDTWCRGPAALGHALLSIEPQEGAVPQPWTRDGEVWVVADVHLYETVELVEKLRDAGQPVRDDDRALPLILHAYRAFGASFASHLVGDFAIAIWDGAEGRLTLVRDHLGVRPLFVARRPGIVLFASDITALRQHPRFDPGLSETGIADFLVFGWPAQAGATVYEHVERVPPAHRVVVDAQGARSERYWNAPRHEAIRYTDERDYAEHFARLFERAVAARIPSSGAGLEMTGGMDSSAIAVAGGAKATGRRLLGFTNTCERLIPEDRDGHYARLLADRLGIPLTVLASEDFPLFDRFGTAEMATAEPFGNPDLAQHETKLRVLHESGRKVLLTGHMGDTLFDGSASWFPHLVTTGRWITLLRELVAHRRVVGSLTGTALRSSLWAWRRRTLGAEGQGPELPTWIRPEFAARIDLEERAHAIWRSWNELDDAYGQLQRPWFSRLFEDYEVLRLPVVARHPFTDLRLVEYMLRLPNHQHLGKRVLRRALGDRLPAEIRERPKQALPGDLRRAKMWAGLDSGLPSLDGIAEWVDVERYVRTRASYAEQARGESTWPTWLINYPIALAFWMHNNDGNHGGSDEQSKGNTSH